MIRHRPLQVLRRRLLRGQHGGSGSGGGTAVLQQLLRGEGVELVQDLLDVADEALGEGAAEVLADDDAEDGDVLRVGGHGVGGDDPAEAAEEVGDLELIVAAAVLEGEGHQRHAVVLGDDVEPAGPLQALPQHRRVLPAVLHDVLVALHAAQTTKIKD